MRMNAVICLFLITALLSVSGCSSPEVTGSGLRVESPESVADYVVFCETGKPGTPLLSDIATALDGVDKVVAADFFGPHGPGWHRTLEIDATEGLQAVENWLRSNLAEPVPNNKICLSFPALQLVICGKDSETRITISRVCSIFTCGDENAEFLKHKLSAGFVDDSQLVAIQKIFQMLTILSYRRYRKTLAKRVDMEQFELNPRWQKAVKAGRFLPLSYLFRVAVSLAVLAVLFVVPEEIFGPDASPRRALVGYLLCTYLVIDLNHLGNLRSFRLRREKPEEAEEKPRVKLGYSYSLGLTQVSYETTFLLLLVLWLILGGYFLFGAAMAPLVIAYRLRFMRANALRKEQGLPPRSYRKLRLAILLLVIAAVLTFIHLHRAKSSRKIGEKGVQSESSGKSE
jgi:hypothetical protein